MRQLPGWLDEAVPALRHEEIPLRFFSAIGADEISPVLTPSGWQEFAKTIASAILFYRPVAARALRNLVWPDRRGKPWPDGLPAGLAEELQRYRITSWSQLGSQSPAELAQMVGTSLVRQLLTGLIHEALQSALAREQSPDLLDDPNRLIEAARQVLEPERDRGLEIWFSRNLLMTKAPTLRELGRRFGVTGAWIQQLEATAERKANALLTRLRQGPVGVGAEQLAVLLGAAYPVDQLKWPKLGLTPEVLRTETSFSGGIDPAQLGLVLLSLAGPYHFDRGWLVRGDVNIFAAAQLELTTAAGNGYPKATAAEAALEKFGIVPAVRTRLIRETEGLKILDGVVCPWPPDAPGRAEVVLRVRGEPMRKSEIAKLVERNLGTVSNALGASDRFVRVDLDRYGLTEWGQGSYEGVVQAMREAIVERNGTATSQQIVDDVTRRFSVSPKSVHAYLGSHQFVRVQKGLYRVRGGTDMVTASSHLPLEQSGACFLLESGWALRLKVNEERLRGSGVGIPRAWALIIGLAPGGDVQCAAATVDGRASLGAVRFTWPTQMPSIGSVAPMVSALELKPGDNLFLAWDQDSGVLRAVGTRRWEGDGMTEAAIRSKIARLIGRPTLEHASTPELLGGLAEALGLRADAGRSRVVGLLRIRGDEELVNLSRVLYDLEARRLHQ